MNTRVTYDTELQLHNEVLRCACDIRTDERVLDIGCGTGQTIREAARLAINGHVVGIDISVPMIEHARKLAEAEGLRNVTFEHGDAEVFHFPAECFDVVISRFGTMFFADSIAAFRNIAKAMKPGGRLVMLVWQSKELNEWFVSIQQALTVGTFAPAIRKDEPDPFSLADPNVVERILGAAGLAEARFTDVNKPVYYGEDVNAALEWVSGFFYTKNCLQHMDSASAERALHRLRETLTAHATEGGVWFNSRAWIVTASRPLSGATYIYG
jgi:SAM-dependent methyltransferase